jgi:hypothetical protein
MTLPIRSGLAVVALALWATQTPAAWAAKTPPANRQRPLTKAQQDVLRATVRSLEANGLRSVIKPRAVRKLLAASAERAQVGISHEALKAALADPAAIHAHLVERATRKSGFLTLDDLGGARVFGVASRESYLHLKVDGPRLVLQDELNPYENSWERYTVTSIHLADHLRPDGSVDMASALDAVLAKIP